MAVFTHRITRKVATAGLSISSEKAYTGDGQGSRDIAIPDSTTDLQVDISIDVSQIQAIFMLSDKDLTLETNDGATPADVINLKAGVPYVWHAGSYFTNLLATDVTKLFLTNNSGSAARFQLEVVVDSTP